MKKIQKILATLILILTISSLTNNAKAYLVTVYGTTQFGVSGGNAVVRCPSSPCVCAGINITDGGPTLDIYRPCGDLAWTIPLSTYQIDTEDDGTVVITGEMQ